GRCHAVVNDLELADFEEITGHRSPPHGLERPIAERPALKIGLKAPPQFRESLGLEQQEQDDEDADRSDLYAKQSRAEPPRPRQKFKYGIDAVGQQSYERGAHHRAEDRAHSADDDHRNIDDRQIQRERFHRHDVAVIRHQAARYRSQRRTQHERKQLIASKIDAEGFGRNVAITDGHPRPARARAHPVHAGNRDEGQENEKEVVPGDIASQYKRADRRVWNREAGAGTAREIRLIGGRQKNDRIVHRKRADREIDAAEPQRRQTDDETHDRSANRRRRKNHDERSFQMDGQKSR